MDTLECSPDNPSFLLPISRQMIHDQKRETFSKIDNGWEIRQGAQKQQHEKVTEVFFIFLFFLINQCLGQRTKTKSTNKGHWDNRHARSQRWRWWNSADVSTWRSSHSSYSAPVALLEKRMWKASAVHRLQRSSTLYNPSLLWPTHTILLAKNLCRSFTNHLRISPILKPWNSEWWRQFG